LTIFYQNPDVGRRTMQVIVNGAASLTLRFDPTDSCCASVTATVTLKGGANTIEFANPDSSGPDVDRIVISEAPGKR
jgi:hypothetical protein